MKTKEQKLQMTPSEIVQMYKEAKFKGNQIKIMAELNLCSQEEIKTILRENGVRLPGGVKQVKKVNSKDIKTENAEVLKEGKSAPKTEKADRENAVKPEKKLGELKNTNKDLEDLVSCYAHNLEEIESLTEILLSVDLSQIESFKGVDLLLRQIKDLCNYF